MANSETPLSESHMIFVRHNSSAIDYPSASNLSRSSSPPSYDDELFNEDSNDSLRKKRKSTSKLPSNRNPELSAKVPKTKGDKKRNAEIQSQEEECLSQQFKHGASIDTPGRGSFTEFDQANNYFSGKSIVKPDFVNSSSRSQQALTKISPKSKASPMDVSSSVLEKSLSGLDQSIETPRKLTAAQAYGPMQKPTQSKQSTKKTRGRKNESDHLIKKAPVPKRLNISERQNEPAKPSKPKSNRKASTVKECAVEAKVSKSASTQPRSARGRVSSVCSSKSCALSDEEDGDQSYTEEGPSRKDLRRQNNNKSARDYRNRQKEKELKLNADITELEIKYNDLRKQLKNVLTKKHVQVQSVIQGRIQGVVSLPGWTRNIQKPEEHFLI